MRYLSLLFKDLLYDSEEFSSIGRIHYPVDIYEENDKLNIEIVALEAKEDQINIQTKDGDELTIRYNKNEEDKNSEDDNKVYFVRNITKREFSFVWKIPPKFDLEKIEAKLINGILKVGIPLKPESKPKKIKLISN